MAKIKNLAFYKKSRLKKMTSFLENEYNNFVPFPLDFIHHFLPLRLKFFPETYVAVENEQIKGVISVKCEKGNFEQLKFTRLLLDEDSHDTGKQLIDYVTSRYSAMGATSFYVIFDETFNQMNELFSKECNFTYGANENLYKLPSDAKPEIQNEWGYFKIYHNCDADFVAELNNQNLHPRFKTSFSRTPRAFAEDFTKGLSKNISFRYVLEDTAKDKIRGYFSITTSDNKNFILNFNLSQAYEGYLEDIINFSYAQISRRVKDFNLFVKINTCFVNADKYENYLKENGFEQAHREIILVKEFYKQVRENSFLSSSLIFNDIKTNPSFKN